MADKHQDDSYRRNVEEAKRTIREDWPDWLRSNRDAVHQAVRTPKDPPVRSKGR